MAQLYSVGFCRELSYCLSYCLTHYDTVPSKHHHLNDLVMFIYMHISTASLLASKYRSGIKSPSERHYVHASGLLILFYCTLIMSVDVLPHFDNKVLHICVCLYHPMTCTVFCKKQVLPLRKTWTTLLSRLALIVHLNCYQLFEEENMFVLVC